MVLNVGRTKMENGQEQSTTDMTTTKQNEVTLNNYCMQWSQYLCFEWNQYKCFDKSTVKFLKSESFNIFQSTS